MKKMITENGVKPIVYCQLMEFVDVYEQYKDVEKLEKPAYVAHLHRVTEHPRLGSPAEGYTRTSLVLNIDFQKKQFETMNTIYRWGQR